MDKILNIFNVEVGQRFNIIDRPYNPYYFDERFYLIDCAGGVNKVFLLNDLIYGVYEIERIKDDDKTVKV
jgi:predicted nuclease of restriction endonuclease-like (RecB) superfamily